MKPGTTGDQLAMKRVPGSVLSVTVTLALIAGCRGESIHTVGEVPVVSPGSGGQSASSRGNGSVGGKGGVGGKGPVYSEAGTAGAAGAENCALRSVTTPPANASRAHGCDATVTCDSGQAIIVSCDDPHDGISTSACMCDNGAILWSLATDFQDEGQDTCFAAATECAETMPELQPSTLGACVFQDITVSPSDTSPTNRCEMTYVCGDQAFTATCEGENYQSVCDCHFGENRKIRVFNYGDGEAPRSCLRAAVECAELMQQ